MICIKTTSNNFDGVLMVSSKKIFMSLSNKDKTHVILKIYKPNIMKLKHYACERIVYFLS